MSSVLGWKVAYFAHELRDPAVQKRIRMLKAAGAGVELLGFERRAFPLQAGAETPTHPLGRTQSGRLLRRAFAALAAVPNAVRLRAAWADADILLARNLEMLAIACAASALTGRKPRIVYECLDIHRLMLGKGPLSALLRAIERACLRRAALVLTSSPAYEHRYFRAIQRWAGEILVVENKLFAPEIAAAQDRADMAPPLTIAWCGVLRCRRSLNMLARLAARPAEIEVVLWGEPALEAIPDFHEIVAAAPGVRFLGPYSASDLHRIYATADFVWTVDYYEAGGNSAWLLPNRLYEGVRFGAVPIAAEGVETARWLGAHGVGVVLEEPLEETLPAFFATCAPARLSALRRAVAALPRSAVEMDEADCRALAARLAGGADAPRPEVGERLLIVIPCLNEAAHLPRLLEDLAKDPGAQEAQIVIVDGGSTDATCAIARAFAEGRPRAALLHNAKRIQSAAVNLAVERFGDGADLLIRIDAHALYPAAFIGELLAARRSSGADAVAVSMRAKTHAKSCFERAVAAAQNSVLGTGGSPHRGGGARRWVDHGHHALMCVGAFRAAGGYDESFTHNEDAELDARLVAQGARILLAGDIVIDYFPRAAPGGLFRQYFAYGRGRARTARRHRAPLKLRQAAPLLVAPAVFAAALAPFAPWAALPAAAWLSACLAYGVALGVRAGDVCACAAGLPAAIMHFAWSLGFWTQSLGEGRGAARSDAAASR